MKTVGKNLNGNVIIELSNEELNTITMSLNSYSLHMDKIGCKHYAKKVDRLFFQMIKFNNSQEK